MVWGCSTASISTKGAAPHVIAKVEELFPIVGGKLAGDLAPVKSSSVVFNFVGTVVEVDARSFVLATGAYEYTVSQHRAVFVLAFRNPLCSRSFNIQLTRMVPLSVHMSLLRIERWAMVMMPTVGANLHIGVRTYGGCFTDIATFLIQHLTYLNEGFPDPPPANSNSITHPMLPSPTHLNAGCLETGISHMVRAPIWVKCNA